MYDQSPEGMPKNLGPLVSWKDVNYFNYYFFVSAKWSYHKMKTNYKFHDFCCCFLFHIDF